MLCYISIVIVFIPFSSCDICSKKVSCPAFNDTLLVQWFPYQLNDRLKFNSTAGQSQLFLLNSVSSSGPHPSTTDRGICHAEKDISSAERDSLGQSYFDLRLLQQDQYGTHRAVSFRLLGVNFQGTELGETGFANAFTYAYNDPNINATLQYYNSIQLNGKTFNKVQSIMLDTTVAKKPFVYKLYISRQAGLIAYETSGPSLLWLKE